MAESSSKKLKIILLIALILRLVYFLNSPLSLEPDGLRLVNSDENTYYEVASLYKEGFVSAITNEKIMWTAPVHPIVLFIMNSLFAKGILATRLMYLLLNVFTIYLLFRISQHREVNFANFSILLLAIYWPLVKLSPMLMTESLYMLFVTLGVFIYFNCQLRNTKMVLVGICFGIATLTRSILLLFPFFLTVVLLFRYLIKKDINKQDFKNCTIFITTFVLIIFPVIAKNYYLFKQPNICTGSGAGLYLGSRPDTEGDEPPYRGKKYDTRKITGKYTHLDIEGDKKLFSEGLKNIKNYPVQYSYWGVKKIGRLLVGNPYYWRLPYQNIYDFFYHTGTKATVLRLFTICIAVFVGIFGFAQVINSFLKQRIPFMESLVIYSVLMSLPFLVNYRYGLPIFIFNVIFAFEGIRKLNIRVKKILIFVCVISFLYIIGIMAPVHYFASNLFGQPVDINVDMNKVITKNINSISVNSHSMKAVATSDDPQIIIPLSDKINLNKIMLRINGSEKAVFQVFYETDNGGFSEVFSLKERLPIEKEIIFPYYKYPINVTRIRIDPINTEGSFSISDIVLVGTKDRRLNG